MKIKLLLLFVLLSNLAIAEQTIEVIPLSSRPASEVQQLLAPFLESSDRVIADGSNLLVRTTPERLAEIRKFIKQLDKPLTNLTITVIQSRDVTADELNAAANIQLTVPRHDLSTATGRITGQYSQFQDSHSNENRQIIRTLEGNTAYIKAGVAYPLESVQRYDAYGRPVISTGVELIDVTTGFAVTPRLAGNQAVLEVSPWSDTFNASGQIETRNVHSTIKVNLGEWVELGAINESRQSNGTANLDYNRRAGENRLRILVKIEKAD